MARTVKIDADRWERIQDALRDSGWTEYPAIGKIIHSPSRDKHAHPVESWGRSIIEASTVGHALEAELNLLDKVLDVFGIKREYPDVTTTGTRTRMPSGSWSRRYGYTFYSPAEPITETYEKVTRGASKFKADLLEAHEALQETEKRDSAEQALARIRGAVPKK